MGAVTEFGTTAGLLAGVLNLSPSEAKARAEQAGLLTPRQSLAGEALPPLLPSTAAELAAGAIGPAHLRVITVVMRRVSATTHPDITAQAEHTLATAARRFDPAALTRIGERLLDHLDPDGKELTDEPEEMRELRVRTVGRRPRATPGHHRTTRRPRPTRQRMRLSGLRPPTPLLPRPSPGVVAGRGPDETTQSYAFSANTITSSCTAEVGTSNSTPADIQNSFRRRPSIPPEHHSTTHSDSKATGDLSVGYIRTVVGECVWSAWVGVRSRNSAMSPQGRHESQLYDRTADIEAPEGELIEDALQRRGVVAEVGDTEHGWWPALRAGTAPRGTPRWRQPVPSTRRRRPGR